jgi:LmbE family N-acetylglucosaminyl deacetylase
MDNKSARRQFIRKASIGLGGMTFSPFVLSKGPIPISDPNNNSAKKLKIVCVGAHPGDPEFGCGGTMAKYAQAGHSVVFIYLTRGEAGDPTKSYSESAALRTKEAETACNFLHVKPVFAGQIDGHSVFSNEKIDEIEKIIVIENPDIVFTQWPIDGHRDHQVTGALTLGLWAKSQRKFTLYFYEVNTGSETMHFTPTDYVDISDVKDLKREAMFAHKSQDPENTYNDYFKPLETFRGLESGVKMAEAFILFKNKSDRTGLPGF